MTHSGFPTMADLAAILPEVYLCALSMFLLLVAAGPCKRVCNAMLGGSLAALLGTAWFVWPFVNRAPALAFNGLFATGGFIAFAQLLILAAATLTLILSANWLKEGEGGKAHPSEFLVLMLFSVLGMLLMVSAADLLTLYMSLEMSSLALYVLAAFSRDHAKSSEAGLKYFVLGALASGMMLFGISLTYGFTGSTNYTVLSQLFSNPSFVASKAVILGMILIMVGLCFKLSAVPFHMWTPDVYEGAPTPVTAFFATAAKIAALALFVRLLMLPFGHLIGQWQQVVVFMSLASMLIGSLAAIMQTNIKRLLAYSSIGHVGFMLMGVAAGSVAGSESVLLYLATYVFMNAGAFCCVLFMRRDGRYIEEIRELAGLSQTHPARALIFSIFLFSMAGIPPLAGFFGKLYVVLAAVQGGLAWLAAIGVLTTVISAYYYLKIVKIMYFDEKLKPFDAHLPLSLKTGLVIAAVFTLGFVFYPTPLVNGARAAAEAMLPKP